MCKVILISEDEEESRTCMVTSDETPIHILKHYGIDTRTKIVYIDGQIISNEKMHLPLNREGRVFLAIKPKTYVR